MLPSRCGTSPMMDFIVVVLPAPLRPSSVTTSPSRTSKSTPCRMWLSPYQEFRSLTSSIRRPQISRDHFRVLRDRRVISLRQHAAARQHRNPVAEPFHHGKVVLHHQDGPALPDPPD